MHSDSLFVCSCIDIICRHYVTDCEGARHDARASCTPHQARLIGSISCPDEPHLLRHRVPRRCGQLPGRHQDRYGKSGNFLCASLACGSLTENRPTQRQTVERKCADKLPNKQQPDGTYSSVPDATSAAIASQDPPLGGPFLVCMTQAKYDAKGEGASERLSM